MSYDAQVTPSADHPSRDGETPAQADATPALVVPQPPAVSSARVTLIGSIGWMVALIVTLIVPALHEGDRDFWPWACVAGIVLGLLGFTYVRRGRGNAAGAEPERR